jgi:tetratricopeptide (TPR) repeat protein
VVNDGDGVRFEFDYAHEPGGILSGGEFIFFNSSGPPDFYLFNTRIDVQSPGGHVIRTEPHPRFFTDRTQTVPAAVIGHVQSEWYPRKLFVVFKTPAAGTRHIFRKGEPFAQIIFVLQRVTYDMQAFDEDEQRQRRELETAIESSRSLIATNEWKNPTGAKFNDHYKVLARAFKDEGMSGVQHAVDEALQRLRSLMPATIAECLARGEALVRQQEFDEAKPIYHHVLKCDPSNSIATRQLGICIACTGAPAAGLDLMKQAIAMSPRDYMHHAAFGQMLMLVGQHREAESAYRAALQLWPDEPELQSGLASAITKQGRTEA